MDKIKAILKEVAKSQAAADARMDRAEARLDRAEARMDRSDERFEKRMRGFEKLVRIGMAELRWRLIVIARSFVAERLLDQNEIGRRRQLDELASRGDTDQEPAA